MHKIDGVGATASNTFTEGDPGTGVAATQVTAKWLNSVQEEIVNVVEDAGITLDDEDNTQLLDAIEALIAANSSTIQYLHVRDEKSAGTHAGAFASGSWLTRTLNTVKFNEITSASLSSNAISLPAGRYRGRARAPAHEVGLHKSRLRDTTNNVTVALGASHRSFDASNNSGDSMIWFDFTLSGTANIELQHRCDGGEDPTGFGQAANLGETEVYAEIYMWKVS